MNPNSSAGDLREEVRAIILAEGFHRTGFARAGRARFADQFRAWVDRGRAGDMTYLSRDVERRLDPGAVIEGARTVIVATSHYAPPQPTPGAVTAPTGRIAAYAAGEDYHRIFERRLRRAKRALEARFRHTFWYYVDTGPVLERDWAELAGLGWIGKNTCVIDPELGSYLLLAVFITTLELDPDPPATAHCGSCRACLDACPTGAFLGPHQLDATRCISYLTMERRGEIAPELEPLLGSWVFGCDVCQEVCPFNRSDRGGVLDPELAPRAENEAPLLRELAQLDEEAFRLRFPRSAVRYARAGGLLRNVIVALGNSGGPEAVSTLEELARRSDVSADPVLAPTVARALARAAAKKVDNPRPLDGKR